MKIRRAKKGETKILQDLNDEIFVDNSKYDSDLKLDWAQSDNGKKYFDNVIKDSQAICLIATINKEPIGYITASPKEFDYRISKYIEIDNMGVSPKHRSKGTGAKLIEKCLEIAKKRGFQKAFLNAYSKNSKTISFYEKNGFEKIDVSLEKSI